MFVLGYNNVLQNYIFKIKEKRTLWEKIFIRARNNFIRNYFLNLLKTSDIGVSKACFHSVNVTTPKCLSC